jgi:hypothetical protein
MQLEKDDEEPNCFKAFFSAPSGKVSFQVIVSGLHWWFQT